MDYKLFVDQFLKYPKEIGTFTTSSKFLARQMTRVIGDSLNVVEFGSGTGAVTAQILKVLRPDGKLTCFEANTAFCDALRKIKDRRITIINDSCENAPKYADCTDCIISSIPLANMTRHQRQHILTIAAGAKKFVQLQYMPLLTKEIKHYFTNVDLQFIALNIPPAFIYVCDNIQTRPALLHR